MTGREVPIRLDRDKLPRLLIIYDLPNYLYAPRFKRLCVVFVNYRLFQLYGLPPIMIQRPTKLPNYTCTPSSADFIVR